MRGYFAYFKTVFISGLQYKVAAIAGVCTQFFWGFLQIFVYQAFYSSNPEAAPISFANLITYVWLQQALFALVAIRYRDSEIANSIKNGQVCYELLRPYNIYTWWQVKLLAKKYSNVLLRFLPIILISLILPEPYRLALPQSITSFVLFLVTLVLGSIVLSGIAMFVQLFTFYTNDDKGMASIMMTIGELFAGLVIPLPLLPNIVKDIAYCLPFRLIGDLPFRVYSGDIPVNEAVISIGVQFIWIIILVGIGNMIMKRTTKKVYIQGG